MEKPPFSARTFTFFAVGFCGLMAQALLFRSYMEVFRGNEVSTGLFFLSWLTWIGGGAALGRIPSVRSLVSKYLEYFVLLYIPAFFLQRYLLLEARFIIGVPEYKMLDAGALALSTFFLNSPISIVTGLLVVAGTSRAVRSFKLPVSHIYLTDALGSFAGAVMVTILLYCNVHSECIAMMTGGILLVLPMLSHAARGNMLVKTICGIAGIAMLVMVVCGYGERWHLHTARTQLSRLLPASHLQNVFSTPQARYVRAAYQQGDCIIRWGSVLEMLPQSSAAFESVYLNLSEVPEARNILVIGDDAIGVCREYSKVDSVRQVTWLSTDPDYPRKILPLLPGRRPAKLIVPGQDPIRWLKHNYRNFDLITLRLPAPRSLSLNRYFSNSFFRLLRRRLSPNGVVSVLFPAGENFMGRELSLTGASLLRTLGNNFGYLVLQAGENSRFFAAVAPRYITDNPEVLEKRFKQLAAKNNIPESYFIDFRNLFDPERVNGQMDNYRWRIISSPDRLLNSDQFPMLTRFAIALDMKMSGVPLNFIPQTADRTTLMKYIIIVIVIMTLGILIVREMYGLVMPKIENFNKDLLMKGGEIMFIVFTTSVIAMALNVILLFCFQNSNGSLFLYFGLLNSLFMLGLFGGGWFVNHLQLKHPDKQLLPFLGLGSAVLMVLLLGLDLDYSYPLAFTPLFTAAGAVSGTWLPRAAAINNAHKVKAGSSSFRLWILDSLGGAIGGPLAAIFLLPMLGLNTSLVVLLCTSLMLLALILFPKIYMRTSALIICCLILIGGAVSVKADDASDRVKQAVQEVTPKGTKLLPAQATAGDDTVHYYKVLKGTKVEGYIFKSLDMVRGVSGYRGEISMMMYISTKGVLRNFTIIACRETPIFLAKVMMRKLELLNKDIANNETNFAGNNVTGASFSAHAITNTMNYAGKFFMMMLDGKLAEAPVRVDSSGPTVSKKAQIEAARYKMLIKNRKLSGHKAIYFRKD
ncbi:MAG: FMN-binding protein [Lentisphaerae bacterium]|nr:FMN-binding protein [Lentisphaerota bacterium]MCP4101583.1 FMN-binding protein [Lentisphaerota bacterium]